MPNPDVHHMDEVLRRVHEAGDALAIAAGGVVDAYVLDGPQAPATRSLPDVIHAVTTVEGELQHQITRIMDFVRNPRGKALDISHYTRLVGGYYDAIRHLRILRTHLENRATRHRPDLGD